MGSGNDGLYKGAELLAEQAKTSGQHAHNEADNVITAFEEVDKQYEELMNAAEENKLTNHPKVIEVVKKFHEVKITYYQMLIGYRFRYLIGTGADQDKILQKASELHGAADSLAKSSGLQPRAGQQDDPQKDLKEQLRQLATALATAVGESERSSDSLQEALNALKTANDGQIVEKAQAVIEKYNDVAEKYRAVEARETDYNKLSAAGEYTRVEPAFEELEKKFDALKKSIVNVLKLRVQELSDKSGELHGKAQTLSGQVSELGSQANALATAASQPGQGLKQKATQLRDAINSDGQQVDQQATDVIDQFEDVRTKYNLLTTDHNYNTHKDKTAVIAVVSAYNDLKKHYDTMLNVTKATTLKAQVGAKSGSSSVDQKIWNQAVQLYEKANTLSGAGQVSSQPNLTGPLEALKKAIGESESVPGLQQALKELSTANVGDPKDLIAKALAVITKYNAVKDAYEKVTAKEEEYTKALKGTGGKDETDKYTTVTTAFQALQFCPPWKLYEYIQFP